jgi:N-alpha-acetyl-L-2,4-diaminobutyrate deacetylase
VRPSPIKSTIDLDKEGVSHGHLKLPYSHDKSAWGAIMIPITVIKNGNGPTALLTGGNHGDEYEGPIALYDLARRLDPRAVSGRIILVPAVNFPAFEAGKRTSPIDRQNLNRSFPGAPEGSVTSKIADFFTRELLPSADIVLDFHSGGRTLDFLPFAAAHFLPDASQQKRCVDAVTAFNAPYSMMMRELDATGMYDTTAEEMGKTLVTTELRGGGTATASTVAIAKRGVCNILRHANILSGPIEIRDSIWLSMEDDKSFLRCEDGGLVEPHCDLGDAVKAGDPIVSVYPTHRCGLEPTIYYSAMDGILAGRHFPGLAKIGDNLAVIAKTIGR